MAMAAVIVRTTSYEVMSHGYYAPRIQHSTSSTFFNLYQEGIKKTHFPGENPLIIHVC